MQDDSGSGLIPQSNVTQSTKTKPKSLSNGIAYMVAGTAIVPVMDAIAKFLGDSISPLQITWGRFLFQFLFMGAAILLIQGSASLKPKRPVIHAIRGILLAIATTFFFFSLVYLPLADAIAIFFVQPMMLTVLSAVFLGETIGWHRRIAVVTGFIGALLIIKPGSDTFTLAALLPLGSAAFYSSYIAVTRAHANIDDPMVMQYASGLGATLFISVALLIAAVLPENLFSPSLPNPIEWLWLASIGLIAAVGHLLVVLAINHAPASLIAPFGYVEIIAATALGWYIFGDWPDALSWLGILIIMLSGLYVFMREQSVNK